MLYLQQKYKTHVDRMNVRLVSTPVVKRLISWYAELTSTQRLDICANCMKVKSISISTNQIKIAAKAIWRIVAYSLKDIFSSLSQLIIWPNHQQQERKKWVHSSILICTTSFNSSIRNRVGGKLDGRMNNHQALRSPPIIWWKRRPRIWIQTSRQRHRQNWIPDASHDQLPHSTWLTLAWFQTFCR